MGPPVWHAWFKLSFYRALHRFGQAKFPDGGSVLGLIESIFSTAPATSKNYAWFKRGENRLKNKQLA